MKTQLKVQSIHQTVQPECDPPLRYQIKLSDEAGLVVHLVNATAIQMLPFARIGADGNPVTRRDSSIEAGDVLTLLDNDPAPDAIPLPPILPGDPVAFPQPS